MKKNPAKYKITVRKQKKEESFLLPLFSSTVTRTSQVKFPYFLYLHRGLTFTLTKVCIQFKFIIIISSS